MNITFKNFVVTALAFVCIAINVHYTREAWDAAKAAQSQVNGADQAVMRMQKILERTESEANRAADNSKDVRHTADIVHTSADNIIAHINKLTTALAEAKLDLSTGIAAGIPRE